MDTKTNEETEMDDRTEVQRINQQRREELLARIGDYPKRQTQGRTVRVPLHKLTGGSK